MKTKRTLLSIIVSLSVFCLSILIDFSTHFITPSVTVDNIDLQGSDNSSLKVYSDQYDIVASNKDRLYQQDTDLQDPVVSEDDSKVELEANSQGEVDGKIKSGQDAETDAELDASSQGEVDGKIKSGQDAETDTEQEEGFVAESESQPEEGLESVLPLESQPEVVESLYADIGISIANSYVNIRENPTTDSNIVGKLYKNAAAKILDSIDDWYYIESGSVKGYLKAEYLKTGIPDEELVRTYGILRISVKADGLNVRKEPLIESQKLTVIYQNECYPVIELLDEWVKINIVDDNVIGYVTKEYVELLVDFEKAISKKEEEELIRLQEEEKERQRKIQEEERIKKETEIKYRDKVDYTPEEFKLLACLVHAEAGNQSYEGKLAVANVVLNRMKSKKYPNTIEAVIYQPGQFSVAKSGSLDKQLKNYENYSSKSQQLTLKATKAALSGENNIGNRLYFHAYKAAVKKGYDKKKNAVKLEDHVFW